ncbi:MAG: hypothetical protein ACLTEX_00755 [Eggerthella lenta]
MADIAAVVALVILGIAFFDIDLTVETSTLVVPSGIMLALSFPRRHCGHQGMHSGDFTVVQVLVWVYFARRDTGRLDLLAAFALSFGLLRARSDRQAFRTATSFWAPRR